MKQLTLISTGLVCMLLAAVTFAQDKSSTKSNQTKTATESVEWSIDFSDGTKGWSFSDKECWKVEKINDNPVLSLHKKKSNYKPKVRSPFHIAIFDAKELTSFQLDIDVLSTHKDYNHRDVCLFFGYQNPSQFYYVHLGKKTDPHANQIFIVDNKPRTKISTKTTDGTNWDKKWHKVRIIRSAESGKIEVFFDDMKTPVMTAENKKFAWGKIGVGSFDDTAQFDNLKVTGKLRKTRTPDPSQ